MLTRGAGFTLVEAVLVTAIFVPLMVGVLGTSKVVTSTLAANDGNAKVSELPRSTVRRIGALARPG